MIPGDSDTHLGLLEAMYDEGLFNQTNSDPDQADTNYYFVIGIRADAWDQEGLSISKLAMYFKLVWFPDPSRYLRGYLQASSSPDRKIAKG